MPTRPAPTLALLLSAALACGGDGDTSGGSTGTSTGAATTAPTSDPGTSSTSTSDATDDTSGDTTGDPTTGTGDTTTGTGDTTGSATDATTTVPTTGDATTGGVDVAGFERFVLSRAAGPCAPDADCDGFTELLAPGTLRFEPFGEPGDPAVEVEISEEDFVAAAAVFADPALIELLAQKGPLCDPPTDVFESMLVQVDGVVVEHDTTTCEHPPLVAARATAEELVAKYVP